MPDKWDQYVEKPASGEDKWAQYATDEAPNAGLASSNVPPKVDVRSPEGPVAQGLTTFERSIADMPSGIVRSLREGYQHRHDPVADQLWRGISSMNPIATEEGSLPMNIGATAANLLPLLISKEGIRESGLGKMTKGALDKTVQTPTRIALQRFGGAGKEPVLLEAIRRKATETERARDFTQRKTEVARENQERAGEHAASMDIARQAHEKAVSEAQAKYQKAAEDYRNSTEQTKGAHAEKVRKAREDWVQKSMDARRAQQESARVDAQRQTLQRGHEVYAEKLRQNLQQTYATVKGRLDARWNHLRETPINVPGGLGMKLRDMPLDSKAIADTVDIAEKKYLQGSPESIKQFRDLMNWMQQGGGKVETTEMGAGGGTEATQLRPITWNEARTHYSNLGDRMFSGDLPGNITNAIRFVRDAGLGEQLRAGAEKAGAGPQYSSLLKDWSGFEHDWRDMSSVTTKGGSPLARARMAPNAATLAPQITGKTGDLVLQRLGKYKDAGASIPLAEGVRKLSGQIKDLPTIRVPKAPGKLELPAEPKVGEPPEAFREPEFKPPRAPRMQTAEPPESVPPIDPVAIRRKKLIEYSARPMSLWDFIGPRLIERPLMSNEAIRNWVARQPRKELEP